MKTAGILGGLGPQSTALFYEEIIRLAQKRKKVEYPRMLINSMSIWDFSNSMNDKLDLFMLLSKEIERIQSEVDFLAIVCNTAHSIIDHLRLQAKVPLLAIQEEVVKKVCRDNRRKVGIIGTSITSNSQIYKKELERFGIKSWALPEEVLTTFNKLIFEEMLHGQSYDAMHQQMLEHTRLLIDQGCDGIILGCTELPLFIKQEEVSVPIYPSTQILAESVLEGCLEVDKQPYPIRAGRVVTRLKAAVKKQ
ncbi:MAG: aspartate/glutamate racemase family protein [Bacteroidetes bacterium]|nr:aspartate/glutamate racemase family protein [Bacteroidota bacterium]